MLYTISYDPNPKHEETKILWEGLSQYAKKARELTPGKSFAFFIRDANHNIQGGCSGYIFYGSMYIDLLWVEESLRRQDYGTKLMQSSEDLAKENHCRFIAVNTMDFEAPEFYKKMGFIIEFERKGYDNNSVFYFLRKNL